MDQILSASVAIFSIICGGTSCTSRCAWEHILYIGGGEEGGGVHNITLLYICIV